MPISAIMVAALAPLTGALFGASYGTAIRIGYEIIYPSLFGDKTGQKVPTTPQAKDVISSLEQMYTKIGGLEAHKFGINQGMQLAVAAAKTGEGSNLMDLALGRARVQGGEIVQMSDEEIEQRRGRTTEGGEAPAGIQLEGDYLHPDGSIRNSTLDGFTKEKIKDMMILISRKQIPANWPSNWDQLIPQYNKRLFESRKDEPLGGRDVTQGPPVPVKPTQPEEHRKFLQGQVNILIQQVARHQKEHKSLELDMNKQTSAINAMYKFRDQYHPNTNTYRQWNAKIVTATAKRDKVKRKWLNKGSQLKASRLLLIRAKDLLEEWTSKHF